MDGVNAGYYEVVGEAVVKTDTIDNLVGHHTFDLIKTDVQGATHDVLLGATRTLETTLALWLDLYFDEVYEGQPLFC